MNMCVLFLYCVTVMYFEIAVPTIITSEDKKAITLFIIIFLNSFVGTASPYQSALNLRLNLQYKQ